MWNIFAIYPIFSVDICKYANFGSLGFSHDKHGSRILCQHCLAVQMARLCWVCILQTHLRVRRSLQAGLPASVRLTGFPFVLAYVRSGLVLICFALLCSCVLGLAFLNALLEALVNAYLVGWLYLFVIEKYFCFGEFVDVVCHGLTPCCTWSILFLVEEMQNCFFLESSFS